jgi:hypothetical protein
MKTHFIFINIIPKIAPFYEIMTKNVVEIEGPPVTSKYGAYALLAGLARLYERMRMHTRTLLDTYMHAGTHTHQYVIIIAFAQQQWFRERTSMLRYTYISCLVTYGKAH